jgi:hypothetical protein
MTDPTTLLERARELREWAKREEDSGIRDRLQRMAEHYEHIAENEQWLAANPASMSSAMNLLSK